MRTQKKHMIDFLFPIVLFFVFALSALVVILLAANIYRSSTEGSTMNFTANTSLSYISEKIHQGNEAGAVYPGTLDGTDALIIEQDYNDTLYKTWIYYYDGALRELFALDGAAISPSDGTALLELTDFEMEPISPSLLKFTCTDTKGQSSSTIIRIF